jgi:glucokinase
MMSKLHDVVIGIDLGGTRIKVGLVADNTVIAKKMIAAQSAKGLQGNLPCIETAIATLLSEHNVPNSTLKGIGLAFPGLVNPKTKQILSTNQKYDDAQNINLENWVKEKWGVEFFLDNDARMAAVGEWKCGAGKDTDNLVVMTIGTGIGTSAIVEGKLLRGKHFQAGCLGGHFTIQYNGRKCTCGNLGCVEAYGATWSLKQTSAAVQGDDMKRKDFSDFSLLFDAIARNDLTATRILQECMDVWAAGIINLIHAYDPEVVVIGGGVMNRQELVIPYLTQKVNQYAWCPWGKVQIRPTQLLSNAGILGVAHCIYHPV